MRKRKAMAEERGLTLIEVLIAMAFIALIYGFVVQVFFHGFKNINMGDIEDEAVRLCNNEMKKLSSIENPLYIGLQEMTSGYIYIDKLKSGELLPYELVEQGIITLGEKTEVKEPETSENSDDIKKASNARANYVRTVEWQVDDAEPVLIHLWVTVKYSDPQQEFKDGEFALETLLVPN
jgi:prepilin-type N-terminal cleavage/methylation domain-containing protein